MKRYVLLIISAVLCLILSACAPADEYPFSPIAIEKRFGDSMDEVVEDLGIDLATAEVVEYSEEQTDITVENVTMGEGQTAAALILSFINDTFYYMYYVSTGDIGYIYDQAAAFYDRYTEQYGEESTYPIPAERISREEFIQCGEDIKAFSAEWKVKNKEISEAMGEDDLRLGITANSMTDANGIDAASLAISFGLSPERLWELRHSYQPQ